MPPRPLRCVISVSGLRGVVGETLDADQVLALAAAYGRTIAERGTVVVGRDSRPSGPMLAQAAMAGLRAVGCDVVDIGVVPTPTVPITMVRLGASGGIQLSASHNPVQWNALKLYAGSGRNVDQAQLDRVLAAYAEDGAWLDWSRIGSHRVDDQAIAAHIDRVLAAVDVERIRKRAFTVVIDSVNGAGSVIAPQLLARLGCRVVPLYTCSHLPFPRDPEPTAANVTETGAVVRAVKADLGFVQDPDADRLAIIDGNGRYIGEEYTLVLCAAARFAALGKSAANAVACTNLSTSRMLEDVAAAAGGRVERAKVGEAHVVDAMQRTNAVIGGEGNGGVIDPRVVRGRDSQIAMALVLERLAGAGASLAEVVSSIPAYAMHKEKIAMDRAAVERAITVLRDKPPITGAEIDARDGIKLSWRDRWVHLRASGTEPVSRIIAEAPSAAEAAALAATVRSTIGARIVEGH